MSSPINNINVSPTASTTNRTSDRRRRSRNHQRQHQRTASDMLGLLGQARYKTRRNSSQLRNTDVSKQKCVCFCSAMCAYLSQCKLYMGTNTKPVLSCCVIYNETHAH